MEGLDSRTLKRQTTLSLAYGCQSFPRGIPGSINTTQAKGSNCLFGLRYQKKHTRMQRGLKFYRTPSQFLSTNNLCTQGGGWEQWQQVGLRELSRNISNCSLPKTGAGFSLTEWPACKTEVSLQRKKANFHLHTASLLMSIIVSKLMSKKGSVYVREQHKCGSWSHS